MAEDPKARDIRPEEKETLLAELNRLEARLRDMEKARASRALVVRGGTVVILVILGLFAYNLISLVRNFDQAGLMVELEAKVKDLAQSAEIKNISHAFMSQLFPQLKAQIVERLKKETPELKRRLTSAGMNIQRHVTVNLKGRMMDELNQALKQLELDITRENPDIQPEKIETVFESARDEFVDKLAASVENRLLKVTAELEALNKYIDALAVSPEVKAMTPDMTAKAENQLLESLLELAIYQLNPARGTTLAYPNGAATTPAAMPVPDKKSGKKGGVQ